MVIYPAVDIKDGKAVRLKKGDFNRVKIYFNDPVDAAKKWIKAGTKVLHVVDLDGAKEGRLVNVESIKRIAETGVDIQLGGGLRNISTIKSAFDIGIKRAVIGTALIKDRAFAREACKEFGTDAIVAGVDLKDGLVAIEGWQEGASVGYQTLLKQLENLGIYNLVVTDIGKDGMQSGPNFSLTQTIANMNIFRVIASGGVTGIEDVRKFKEMGVSGAIVGTALYEGKIDLREAMEVAGAG